MRSRLLRLGGLWRPGVYVDAGSDQEAAVCWDADTGRELWRFRYPCSPLLLDHGDGPRSTPTVDGDLVYFLGAAGDLHCLTVAEGRSLWHHDLGKEFGGAASFGKPAYWGYACSPLVEGDSLFTMTGGTADNALAAFDKRSGAIIWKALNDPLSYSSPIAATIDGRRQIVFFTGRGLVGVLPNDGFALWRYPWETNDNCNVATPIASANYLFLSSGYDRGCAVLEIKRTSGGMTAIPVYSNKRMRNHFATSILYQEHIYGFDNSVLGLHGVSHGQDPLEARRLWQRIAADWRRAFIHSWRAWKAYGGRCLP